MSTPLFYFPLNYVHVVEFSELVQMFLHHFCLSLD